MQRDIVPAAASFAVTFAAGMGFTLFELTGGFPDPLQDRPGFVQNETVGPQFAAIDAPLLEATATAPAENETEQNAPAEPDAVPLAYETDLPVPPTVMIDTESVDSILARNTPADQPPLLDGGEETSGPPAAPGSPPEVLIDIPAAPTTYQVR